MDVDELFALPIGRGVFCELHLRYGKIAALCRRPDTSPEKRIESNTGRQVSNVEGIGADSFELVDVDFVNDTGGN